MIEKVDFEIDYNRWISDITVKEPTIHQIQGEKTISSDKFEKHEFGEDLIFLWEFKSDVTSKRYVTMKYYALDEIMEFIGGNMGLFISLVGILVVPFGEMEFVIDNSSKKEEIELHMGQSIEQRREEAIKKYKDALDDRKKF